MGRPLNKKYFGNRNLGSSSTTADDELGGKRVASVTIDTPGVYTTRATATFDTPDLTGAGAVRATGTVTMEALAVTVNAGGTDYDVGDLITVDGAGGLVVRVASVSDAPTNGVVLTVDFTGGSRGEQTVLTGLTSGVTTTKVTGEGGDDLTVDVTYRVKAVVVTEQGSGYTNAADAAVTFSNGAGGAGDKAAGTVVLETDSGSAFEYGNNENAIVAYAYLTGGSLLRADIVKQTNDRRFKVENATGTGICELTTTTADAAGEMNVVATDSAGGTYLVKKITSRKVVLVPAAVARLSSSAGSQFASGQSAKWSFTTTIEDSQVVIENA
jgi:hypothetical protein